MEYKEFLNNLENKESTLSTEDVFNEIYRNNFWDSQESISGKGSEIIQTEYLVEELQSILKKFQIKSILDIPCGDFNWMKFLNLENVKYTGADIVDEIVQINKEKYYSDNIEFKKLNIIEDKLPNVDLIFCRDCLGHFSFEDIIQALVNIKKSGSKYLMATSHSSIEENRDIKTGSWRPLNLLEEPFSFPMPIYTVNEKSTLNENLDKTMLLWKIEEILQRKQN